MKHKLIFWGKSCLDLVCAVELSWAIYFPWEGTPRVLCQHGECHASAYPHLGLSVGGIVFSAIFAFMSQQWTVTIRSLSSVALHSLSLNVNVRPKVLIVFICLKITFPNNSERNCAWDLISCSQRGFPFFGFVFVLTKVGFTCS